jgi:hypothetical protein
VLQETDETERAARAAKALFPVDPLFVGLSYNQRYQMMISRFLGDQITTQAGLSPLNVRRPNQ